MYIRRKVFSTYIDENGEEKLFSTTEIMSEESYLEKLYSENEPEQKEFSSKAQKVLKNKFLASYVKPGYSVPKSKVREYLKNKAPEINTKGDLINWGINIKAGHSGGLSGVKSTHLDSTGVTKNNKFYDHRKSDVVKNKETMKFVRDVINKNK